MRKFIYYILSSKAFRVGFALAISLVTLFLATRDVDFRRVGISLANAEVSYIGLAMISLMINHLSKAVRWRTLIIFGGEEVSFREVFASLIIGQMFNYYFPARVGDLGRAYVVGGKGPGRSFTLGTVVLEKFFDILAYGVLFLTSLYFIPFPNWLSRPSRLFTTVVFLLAVVVVFMVFYREPFFEFLDRVLEKFSFRKSIRDIAQQLKVGLSSFDVLRDCKTIITLFFWTGMVWSTSILINHFTLQALQIELPILASMLILVTLQAGISVPSIPGRIGIFEYICVLVLSLYGVEESLAFSYGVLLHALVLLPLTFLGVYLFWVLGLSYRRVKSLSSSEGN